MITPKSSLPLHPWGNEPLESEQHKEYLLKQLAEEFNATLTTQEPKDKIVTWPYNYISSFYDSVLSCFLTEIEKAGWKVKLQRFTEIAGKNCLIVHIS